MQIKDKGAIRTQFHHVIDIAPTIPEAVGLQSPSVLNGVPQKPIEGTSLVYTFDNATALSKRRTQYFEMFANRAIYNDGWIACTTPPLAPWEVGKTIDVDDCKWELYNVDKDFSEGNDLAAKNPKKLGETARPLLDRGSKIQRAAAGQQQDRAHGRDQSGLPRCAWRARRSPLVIFPALFRFASRQTRRSTSAKTPAHP
jgi:arylsulfatase A-like enzyme